jgi:hypothetical protein
MGWFSSTRRETVRSLAGEADEAGIRPWEPGEEAAADQSRLDGVTSLLLESHGIRAPSVARHEALRARQSGDGERAAEWAEIALRAEAALSSDV